MLRFLTREKKQVLDDYPWVQLFFDSKLDRHVFEQNVESFADDFRRRGFDDEDIAGLRELAKGVYAHICCEGRFPELTAHLHEALKIVAHSYDIHDSDLKNSFELVVGDLGSSDPTDPYFDSRSDLLRPNPLDRTDSSAYVHLVPLVSRIFALKDGLVRRYAEKIGAPGMLLVRWDDGIDLDKELGLRLVDKVIPIKKETAGQRIGLSAERASLRGYSLKTLFGIGRCIADIVVPDTPYSIEVYDPEGRMCLLIGFWYRHDPLAVGKAKDIMVVGQIQQPKAALIPGHGSGSQLGIVALSIAKIVAQAMGFGVLQTYSADRHPMFLQYPDRKSRMKGDFTGYYDTSAKALGFEGSRTTFYTLKL